jgi:nucleotide-binding universal stress UspA family protein
MLLVLDGHELAEETYQRVCQFIRIARGDVLVLRALEPRLAVDALEDPLTNEATRAEARRYLSEIARQLRFDGATVTTRLTTGLRTGDAILHAVREYAADLIVVVDS